MKWILIAIWAAGPNAQFKGNVEARWEFATASECAVAAFVNAVDDVPKGFELASFLCFSVPSP